MSKQEKIFLDARELEHPVPLERAMYALRELNEENYFYMMHRKKPIPLIDLAVEQGFNTLSREDTKGTWHVLISKDPSLNLETLCNV
jgi:TusA-related sulfurtransferase